MVAFSDEDCIDVSNYNMISTITFVRASAAERPFPG